MQAQNTLNFAVHQQKNKVALYVVFSFARIFNALSHTYSVTQRIAHCVVSIQHDATNEQIAQIVAKQQQLDNAASVQDYTSNAVRKLLHKNDDAAYN